MTLPAGIIKLSYQDRDDYYLGSCLDGVMPFHVGQYTDGAFSVPEQWWNAVARNRKDALIAKVSPAQIVANNRMFPLGDTGAKVGTVTNYIFRGPMDSAGITIYMPTTGERPDIGLITDPSAYYMLTGKPGPMLAWAQAGSSCPMHFRDENTGKPISLLTYPAANCYQGNQGSPRLDIGTPTPTSNGYHQFGGGWTPQQAHYCEMSYLAHVATLDTGFLEDLQYSANFTILCDGYVSGARKIATVSGELRGVAWAFRNLFMAHAATQDAEAAGTLPATCLPAAYWKTLLDNQLAYYKQYMIDPSNQTFRLVSGGNRFGPWQCDYMLMSLAFGVLTGHSDWAPLYVWALGNAIARSNGTSGYPPGWGGAYYLNTNEWAVGSDGKPDQHTYDPAKPLDWSGTFLYQQSDPNGARPTAAQIAALKDDPLNGGKAMVGNEYLMAARGVLVQAQYLDKLFHTSGGKDGCDVKSVYPDLDLCFTNADRMVRNYGVINPRQSYVLDASGVPDTIPPIPPVTLPTEEPPMSNPGNDPLAPLKAAADSLVALVPQVQAAVDNLEAQIAALTAAAASGAAIPAADIAAIVAKLNGVKTGLAAAVTDAATPG